MEPKDEALVDDAGNHPDDKNENPTEEGKTTFEEPQSPQPEDGYREGTIDNDHVNIPGPNELPDQQKVAEDGEDSEKAKENKEN
jgi:hypothetical protein